MGTFWQNLFASHVLKIVSDVQTCFNVNNANWDISLTHQQKLANYVTSHIVLFAWHKKHVWSAGRGIFGTTSHIITFLHVKNVKTAAYNVGLITVRFVIGNIIWLIRLVWSAAMNVLRVKKQQKIVNHVRMDTFRCRLVLIVYVVEANASDVWIMTLALNAFRATGWIRAQINVYPVP